MATLAVSRVRSAATLVPLVYAMDTNTVVEGTVKFRDGKKVSFDDLVNFICIVETFQTDKTFVILIID